ncbi:MAG TPA: HNH endonuclease signature motif containing protein [Jatrophihabitans sp.]|nr:HNH endonuclease signature motif containing protein [Jatrophihabitans sp.]
MTRPRRAPGYKQPPGWRRTVARIIARDRGVCYLCGKPGATSADHVKPVAEGGQHNDANLAAVHPHPCHAAKTEQERLRALRARARRRPPRRNPNLVD